MCINTTAELQASVSWISCMTHELGSTNSHMHINFKFQNFMQFCRIFSDDTLYHIYVISYSNIIAMCFITTTSNNNKHVISSRVPE